MTMTKEQFKNSIIDGIKAGRLDPCNGVEFGEIYTDLPQYYWCVEDDEVTEESPFYTDDEQPKFRFGVSISDIENFTELAPGFLLAEDIAEVSATKLITAAAAGSPALANSVTKGLVSAVMVPSSSMPVKEKIAIWKPAKKPVIP